MDGSLSFVVAILLFVLGLCMGSFGFVLVLRIPAEETMNGRSHCPKCKKTLSPMELVPIVSYLWLRGKCKHCHVSIPLLYPLAEIASAAAFLLAGVTCHFALVPSLLLGMVFWCMLTIAFIDARTQMIPDILTAILGASALAYQMYVGTPGWTGALLGFCFFAAQWLISRGLWVGSGDILLAAALGLLVVSWRHMLVTLMAAYMIGALIVSVLLGLGMLKRNQHIAFGPFLVAGGLVAFFFGDWIIELVVPI